MKWYTQFPVNTSSYFVLYHSAHKKIFKKTDNSSFNMKMPLKYSKLVGKS